MNTKDILDVAKALQATKQRWYFRYQALQYLREHDVAAHPALLPILLEKLSKRDDSPEILVAIAQALLPHIRFPVVFTTLRRGLRSPLPSVRVVAIQAMGTRASIHPDLVRELLDHAQNERDPYVSRVLVETLTPEAADNVLVMEWLIRVATHGDYVNREPAILALLYWMHARAGLVPVLSEMVRKKQVGDPDLARHIRNQVKGLSQAA